MATDTWGESLPISVTYDLSTFKNHGDYISQQGGDAEAAHSPIGKPITSNKITRKSPSHREGPDSPDFSYLAADTVDHEPPAARRG